MDKYDKVKKMVKYLEDIAKEEFNGHVVINFTQGHIRSINKTENLNLVDVVE